MKPVLNLGAWRHLDGSEGGSSLRLPAEHLVTHAVIVGMTGSGKTGLCTVMIEEAARARVPTIVIDVKGDLPNLLLTFPSLDPSLLEPWVEHDHDEMSADQRRVKAAELSERRRSALAEWEIGEAELAAHTAATHLRVLTPGGTAGEPLHMLSSLERRSARWDSDPEAARNALTAAVSLVLRPWAASPTLPRAENTCC